MDKDEKGYLSDILKSIDLVEHHIKDVKSLQEYQNNFLVADAVLRRLAIIGEALAKAIKLNPKIQVSNQKKLSH